MNECWALNSGLCVSKDLSTIFSYPFWYIPGSGTHWLSLDLTQCVSNCLISTFCLGWRMKSLRLRGLTQLSLQGFLGIRKYVLAKLINCHWKVKADKDAHNGAMNTMQNTGVVKTPSRVEDPLLHCGSQILLVTFPVCKRFTAPTRSSFKRLTCMCDFSPIIAYFPLGQAPFRYYLV